MCAGKELEGLERFFRRVDLRFQKGQRNVPLNPLDKGLTAFSSKITQAVSEEFIEPEPNQGDQGASEK